MRESGLRLDTAAEDAAESLVVINKDTAKQINDLASGESGRPFFEANVALRALTERGSSGKHKLADVVAQLNGVVRELHQALDAELASPQAAGASLAELSLPRNSYFVKLREDTTAAIRSAYDKFSGQAEQPTRFFVPVNGATVTSCMAALSLPALPAHTPRPVNTFLQVFPSLTFPPCLLQTLPDRASGKSDACRVQTPALALRVGWPTGTRLRLR